ncbi:hypothetical protein, partial [Tabrizicola sp.]|uniref:hypothetical protein n=1 Tax=Tabrizicola sp. TaxID=2005166 RepID=UPI003F3F0766
TETCNAGRSTSPPPSWGGAGGGGRCRRSHWLARHVGTPAAAGTPLLSPPASGCPARCARPRPDPDPRIKAIATAVREGRTLTLAARSPAPLRLRPDRLGFGPDGWWVSGPPLPAPVPLALWGDINISRAPVDIAPPPA